MARVFVTRQLPGPALDRLRAAHMVDVWPEQLPPSPHELCARVAEADGLLALPSDRIDAALLDGAPRLRAIANYAVGYDNIDLDAARGRGIHVGKDDLQPRDACELRHHPEGQRWKDDFGSGG